MGNLPIRTIGFSTAILIFALLHTLDPLQAPVPLALLAAVEYIPVVQGNTSA